jgi:HAD superfamily hydrolase (TIGR01509 family)
MDTSRDRQSALPTIHAAEAHPKPWLPGQIRAVLLDLGNVLSDDTLWQRWLVQLLSRLGLRSDCQSFLQTWDRDYVDDVHCGRRGFYEALKAFLSSVGLSRSQIDEVEAACRGRRHLLENAARPLPGVRTALARLNESGFALGTINNSEHPAHVLRKRLDRFALGELFAAVVSSIDLKRAMPDPACYLSALAALNLPAQRVAFVGRKAAELAGATAAGMPTIALNADPDARADVCLARFEDLAEVLSARPPLAAAG